MNGDGDVIRAVASRHVVLSLRHSFPFSLLAASQLPVIPRFRDPSPLSCPGVKSLQTSSQFTRHHDLGNRTKDQPGARQ